VRAGRFGPWEFGGLKGERYDMVKCSGGIVYCTYCIALGREKGERGSKMGFPGFSSSFHSGEINVGRG